MNNVKLKVDDWIIKKNYIELNFDIFYNELLYVDYRFWCYMVFLQILYVLLGKFIFYYEKIIYKG